LWKKACEDGEREKGRQGRKEKITLIIPLILLYGGFRGGTAPYE